MTCPGMLSPSSPPEYTLILLGIAPAKVLAQLQCDPLVIGGLMGRYRKYFSQQYMQCRPFWHWHML